MKANVPIIDPKTLPAELRKHLTPFAQAIDRYRQIFTGQVSIGDNMFASFVSFEAKHGALTPVANPLKSKPKGFTLLEAIDSDGNLLGVSSCTADLNRSDGRELGITVNYDLRHTEPCIEAYLNASQLIGNGTDVVILWDRFISNGGGSAIAYNSTTGIWTINETGLYQFSIRGVFNDAAVTYSATQVKINNNGGAAGNIVEDYLVASHTFRRVGVSTTHYVAAGSVFRGLAFQTSGGSRNFLGGLVGSRMAITRLRNDSTPTGRVLGIVWGG